MQRVPSQKGLKFINQQKILNLIYNESPISRVELAERTFLTQQTVTNIVNRLMEDNLVMESQSMPTSRGRKPIPLVIQTSKLNAIGVEVAVKYVSGKLIDFSGKVIAEAIYEVDVFKEEEETLACIRNVIDKLLKAVANRNYLKGIGISIQGLVDTKQGIVKKSPGLAWENFPLVEKLQEVFDYPVYVENDVNLLAIIENQNGSLMNSDNNVVLKFDHGIGGSIIYHKKLYVGSSHVAGEFGHIKAFSGADAYRCHCGSVGCLTTLASNSGLINNKKTTLEEFASKVRKGDAEAKRLLGKIIDAIGIALSNIVTFINPDQILLTGRVMEKMGDIMVPQLDEIVHTTVPESCRNFKLHRINKSLDEAILAGKLVIKKFFDVPLEILSL
ncbi:ROK family protein [Virgibacillus dakarensis]|nr:ROK family protein [Virgibacillus dakarensis]